MDKNFEEIWSESDWTREARLLMQGFEEFADNSNLILFLRHSHRESITNVEEMANLGLTELGRELAKMLGSKLPTNRTLRLYYSSIPRCKETARYILKGFRENGGKGKKKGPLLPLYQVEGDVDYIVEQIFSNPDEQLINRWAAGHFPSDKIQPLNIYSHETAKIVFNKVKEAPSNNIDIFVTHDLQIMALRFSWFGLEAKDYWASYLGGFLISKTPLKTKFISNGTIYEAKTPYWWNNL